MEARAIGRMARCVASWTAPAGPKNRTKGSADAVAISIQLLFRLARRELFTRKSVVRDLSCLDKGAE